ncbi:PHB depolymerase family esterase [Algoriphagus sp. SE2]|uniref:PHB depolymerase family esterase n=1 Tax=Algoriphagus sp. SE2 TaxID=3141536 RepID=UPI0031CD9EC0
MIHIINQTIRNHQVDSDRVYLTGVSRGGHGTSGLAKKYPEKFSAIVPIAGALSCKSNCEGMADLPMWIFHNDCDPVVDYEYPQTAVTYLELNWKDHLSKNRNWI